MRNHGGDAFVRSPAASSDHSVYRVARQRRLYYENSDQNFLSTPGLSNRYNPATGELTQDYTWAVVNDGAGVSTLAVDQSGQHPEPRPDPVDRRHLPASRRMPLATTSSATSARRPSPASVTRASMPRAT